MLEKAGFVGCGHVPGVFGETLLFERFETPPPPRLSSPVGTGWALKIQHTWDGDWAREGEAVSVALELGEIELSLKVDAPFYGDPPPDSEDLWAYEVVELMLVGAGETYLEVELSPHGHHLVLFLCGERHVVHRGVVLDYRAEIEGNRWRGLAQIPIGWLPLETTRLNAFAMHGKGQKRRYLAWRPTRGQRPDYHQLAEFGTFGDDSIVRSSPSRETWLAPAVGSPYPGPILTWVLSRRIDGFEASISGVSAVSMTQCRECHHEVSTQAGACPHCGAPSLPTEAGAAPDTSGSPMRPLRACLGCTWPGVVTPTAVAGWPRGSWRLVSSQSELSPSHSSESDWRSVSASLSVDSSRWVSLQVACFLVWASSRAATRPSASLQLAYGCWPRSDWDAMCGA